MEAVRPFGVMVEKKLNTWEMVAKERSQRLGTSIKNKIKRPAREMVAKERSPGRWLPRRGLKGNHLPGV